jgi:signal transduction histidine kinase
MVGMNTTSEAAWTGALPEWLLRGQARWRRADRRRPWLRDLAVMALVALLAVPDLVGGAGHGPLSDDAEAAALPRLVVAAFVAALILPLWWRRRAPAAAVAAIAAVSLLEWSLGVWLQAGVALLVALYSLARHGSLRALAWASGIVGTELAVAVFFLLPVRYPLPGLFLLLGTATAAVAVGLTVRTRNAYLAALEDRAARLDIERDQRIRLTAAAERSRVAREMHDIVGHNLSVMIGLADGAATLATTRGERSAEPLRLIGDTGRQALQELRRVLGVLRDDTEQARLTPQPGIADLDELISRIRAAGLTVGYRSSGDVNALGRGVQLAVYRVVQEALTNTLKHAGAAATATVVVAAGDDRVRVRVTDAGPPPTARPKGDDQGHGLVGIRERASLYGGEVNIGPAGPAGGWVVDVLLLDRPGAAGGAGADRPGAGGVGDDRPGAAGGAGADRPGAGGVGDDRAGVGGEAADRPGAGGAGRAPRGHRPYDGSGAR